MVVIWIKERLDGFPFSQDFGSNWSKSGKARGRRELWGTG
jgi:hypothetical protein